MNPPFFGLDREGPPVRFSDPANDPTAPVFEARVLRYADGRTEVLGGELAPLPEFQKHRHEMLIDALVVVNEGRVL